MDREVAEKMIRVCESLGKMLELASQGYRMLTEESIKNAEKMINEVRRSSSELTGHLISKGSGGKKGKEWAKPFLSMASRFDRMSYNLEGIVDRLRAMVRGNVLFSDRAVKEINDIFQKTLEILRNLPDLILTENRLLAQQIEEKGKSVFKAADGYSEGHEERLIEGVCMPKASPIYLGILESLKAIVAHALEVSGKIVSP